MTLQHESSDLPDGDDVQVDEWTLEEFDDFDGAAELHDVRSIAARHLLDD